MLIQKSKHRFNLHSNSKVFCLLFSQKSTVTTFLQKSRSVGGMPADLEISIIKCNQSEIKYSTPCINGKY